MFRNMFFLTLLAGVAGALIADKKGRNWIAWGAICAIFPFMIILLALLSNKLRPGLIAKRCAFCNAPNAADATFCARCGRELPIELVRCANCGKYVPMRDYCIECNKSLRP